MTPRPGFVSKRRPLSAIFLGDAANNPSPSNLPDLPEPPSPGAESTHSYASGLPSPPATNSTGSGGDKSADGGSVRRRSVSDTVAEMSNGHAKITQSRSSSPSDDGDGGDEDTTARINHLRRRSSQTSSENAAALQRVLSLTQRNRMALDKLSRLNTPSPVGRRSQSPLPPLAGPPSSHSSAASSTSSRHSTHAHSHSFPTARDRDGLSGSETERDPHAYSSDELSSTPPSTFSRSTDPRIRTTSMPNSPERPGPSSSQQRTPRKRISLASAPDSDVTQAALASVASMRRSPTLGAGRKNRQPLPKEFFDTKKSSSDGRGSDGRVSKEPTTPQKSAFRALANSPSPSRGSAAHLRDSSLQLSPHRSQPRTSAARELTRKHQTRWMSEDLNAPVYEDEEMKGTGRRQAPRQGSVENSLGARLAGQSLRAAGIRMRKDDVQAVFSDPEPSQEAADSRSRGGPSRASSVLFDPRTPAPQRDRSRPATSMADFSDPLPPQTAPPAVRYQSAYPEHNREGIGSSSRQTPQPGHGDSFPTPLRAPQFAERTYGSPRPRPREYITSQNGRSGRQSSMADEQSIEHLRLVADALTVFETQLSRLPLMGDTTTTTVPDLFRDAQSVVRSAEQVNSMLRLGTNRSLERQIDAEVDDDIDSGSIDMVQLWQDVGADFRDCLRTSDELVRTMANFLVGAGKVLREASAASAGGGMAQHLRAASLDSGAVSPNNADARSSTHSGSGKSNVLSSGLRDGRKSAESRLSWEATRADVKRGPSRAGQRASLQLRERDTNVLSDNDMPPPQSAISTRPSISGIAPSSSMRRIYTPRENKTTSQRAEDSSFEYEEVEPSPTPPARHQPTPTERLRGLAPIAIPRQPDPPPKDTPLSRRVTVPDRSANRRKISANSNITVRAGPPPSFAVPPTPGATTAITPATASSNHTPDRMAFPVQRQPSDTSSRRSGAVTFSRATSGGAGPPERKRTISATSPAEVTDEHAYAATPLYGGRAERVATAGSGRGTGTLGRKSTVAGPRAMHRQSLDGALSEGQQQPATNSRTLGSARKERRRTITEIFSS